MKKWENKKVSEFQKETRNGLFDVRNNMVSDMLDSFKNIDSEMKEVGTLANYLDAKMTSQNTTFQDEYYKRKFKRLNGNVDELMDNVVMDTYESIDSIIDEEPKPKPIKRKQYKGIKKRIDWSYETIRKQLHKALKNEKKIARYKTPGVSYADAISSHMMNEVEQIGTYTKNGIKRNVASLVSLDLSEAVKDNYRVVSGQRLKQYGKGIVIISQHRECAPMCEPIQGKLIALDKKSYYDAIKDPEMAKKLKPLTGINSKGQKVTFKPIMSEAREWYDTRHKMGLYHRYCSHTQLPYLGEDETPLPKKISKADVDKKNKIRNEALYIERNLNKWNAKHKATLPDTKARKDAYKHLKVHRERAKTFKKNNPGMPIRGLKRTANIKVDHNFYKEES